MPGGRALFAQDPRIAETTTAPDLLSSRGPKNYRTPSVQEGSLLNQTADRRPRRLDCPRSLGTVGDVPALPPRHGSTP